MIPGRLIAEIEALREHFEDRGVKGADALAVMGMSIALLIKAVPASSGIADHFLDTLRASILDLREPYDA